MKITIVMGFFLPVPALAGGATEKIWHHLGENMAEEGHDVTIVSRRWPGLANKEPIGRLTHLRLPGMNHTRHLALNLILDAWWGVRVMLALPQADVVICNTVSLPVYLRWLKPSAGRVAVVLGRMPKGQNRFYGTADLILATSTAVVRKALSENPSLAPRLLQFPNPIDWPLHAQAADRGTARALTIGYAGRIHPEKGLEQLLEAACRLDADAALPPWRLLLVGPVAVEQGGGGGAYRDHLCARYGPRLGGRLQVVPPIFDKSALARLYGQLDVFCYPSLAAQGEGLSIAPIEAMAAGAVPVVSKLECYQDLINEGVNGRQFDQTAPQAVDELAAILRQLLLDDDHRRSLAAAAQETARRFDYRDTSRLLLARFRILTGEA